MASYTREQKQFIGKMFVFNVWRCPVNAWGLLTEFQHWLIWTHIYSSRCLASIELVVQDISNLQVCTEAIIPKLMPIRSIISRQPAICWLCVGTSILYPCFEIKVTQYRGKNPWFKGLLFKMLLQEIVRVWYKNFNKLVLCKITSEVFP